jgi:hypothetical protein
MPRWYRWPTCTRHAKVPGARAGLFGHGFTQAIATPEQPCPALQARIGRFGLHDVGGERRTVLMIE